jgi:hypothetical protein
MTPPDLRNLLHDLGDEARVPDLLDRSLAASRRIRRRRLTTAAVGALTVVALTIAVTIAAPWRSSDDPVVNPPATETPTPSTSTGTSSTTGQTTTGSSAQGTGQTEQPPTGDLTGTVYYLVDANLYARTGSGQPRLVRSFTDQAVAVSPDGQRVAWIDLASATLMVSAIDGSAEHAVGPVANMGGLCNQPVWFPDSRRVLAATGMDNTWSTFDSETGAATPLGVATGCYPTVSPDGRTIGWYDGASDSGTLLTDAQGGSQRHIPAGAAPCPGTVYAVGPSADRALVSRPDPDNASCGDGPGRSARNGTVVDTGSGQSAGPADALTTGVFLPDGRMVARTVAGELVLLTADLQVAARLPAPGDSFMVVLGYVP